MRNLAIWNETPWFDTSAVRRDLNLFFDEPLWGDTAVSHPACEISETPSHFLVSLDVPGVAKKDIAIELEGNQITVSGERKNPRFAGRVQGKFYRAIRLPEGVDTETIEAEYQDGVLTLAVPKAETAKKKQIKISEGKSSFFGRLLGSNQENSAETEPPQKENSH